MYPNEDCKAPSSTVGNRQRQATVFLAKAEIFWAPCGGWTVALYSTVICHTVTHYSTVTCHTGVLYCTVTYHTVANYCTVTCNTVAHYSTVTCHTGVLYCTVTCHTGVLYCTVTFHTVALHSTVTFHTVELYSFVTFHSVAIYTSVTNYTSTLYLTMTCQAVTLYSPAACHAVVPLFSSTGHTVTLSYTRAARNSPYLYIYLSIANSIGSTFHDNSKLTQWRSLDQQPIQAPGVSRTVCPPGQTLSISIPGTYTSSSQSAHTLPAFHTAEFH